MASKTMRIAKSITKHLGGDDPDAPPQHLPRYQTRPLFATVRTPVPTAKTSTAMGVVLIGTELARKYHP